VCGAEFFRQQPNFLVGQGRKVWPGVGISDYVLGRIFFASSQTFWLVRAEKFGQALASLIPKSCTFQVLNHFLITETQNCIFLIVDFAETNRRIAACQQN
jgi:hypothetical protein